MHPIKTDMLLCPQCTGVLQLGPTGSERLDCQNCPLSYPIRDGIPIMVIQQASTRAIGTDADFERLLAEAIQAPFSGWDFSWLEGRRERIPDPRGEIDYEGWARARVAKATALLDLGTGGGEVLSRLARFHSSPSRPRPIPPT